MGIVFEKKLSNLFFFPLERIKCLALVELRAAVQTECAEEKANLKERHEIQGAKLQE